MLLYWFLAKMNLIEHSQNEISGCMGKENNNGLGRPLIRAGSTVLTLLVFFFCQLSFIIVIVSDSTQLSLCHLLYFESSTIIIE